MDQTPPRACPRSRLGLPPPACRLWRRIAGLCLRARCRSASGGGASRNGLASRRAGPSGLQ
eukprot:2031261-Lingulodinium_polyedra.AAC.1